MSPAPKLEQQPEMSPDTVTRDVPTALYQGKVHFHMPSAEASFALPENDAIDQDSMAREAVQGRTNGADGK